MAWKYVTVEQLVSLELPTCNSSSHRLLNISEDWWMKLTHFKKQQWKEYQMTESDSISNYFPENYNYFLWKVLSELGW